jgi:hypothetical protein
MAQRQDFRRIGLHYAPCLGFPNAVMGRIAQDVS